MIGALLMLLSGAAQADPEVRAIWSSDGSYVLILHPDDGWLEAELVVGGDDTHQLGAVEAGAPVRVEGRTDGGRPLRLSLAAARADGSGYDWEIEVDPTWVPLPPPPLDPRPAPADGRRTP